MSDVEEIWFTCPCPAPPCNGNGPSYEWTHHNCGGYEKVNRKGILRCLNCGSSGPLYDWKFKCSEHDFAYGSYQGFKHMLNVVLNLSDDDDEVEFIADLTNIVKRWKKENRFHN